ncbi:MAG: TadE family protein [Dehalococcoidia bacterium]
MFRRARYQRGQSLVEFALLLPLLLIIMLGVLDFGRVYFAYVSVTNAARNGAHYASATTEKAGDLDGIRGAALADTENLLNTSPTNPAVSAQTGLDSQGKTYASVTVSYTFETMFPWPGIPDSVDMQRTVRMRVAE